VTTDPALAALLADVLACPDDDTPRLVYADRLEELGEGEHAEFIRLQCEIDRWVRTDWMLHQKEELTATLRRRERELLESATGRGYHCWEWMGLAVKDHVVPDGAYWRDHVTFRRGFVHSITLTAADFLAHAGSIFAAQPVQSVELSDREPYNSLNMGKRRCFWSHPVVPGDGSHASIPEPIFLLLTGYSNQGASPRMVRWYESETDARAALCAACVAYGRGRAGAL
jgi:uncharacterized protein (TIGR02996 family)